jgi:hypothetical protein
MGRIYQKAFVDTDAKVGFAKLYDVKTAITAADLLNERVLRFYKEHGIPLLRVLAAANTAASRSGMNTKDALQPRNEIRSRRLPLPGSPSRCLWTRLQRPSSCFASLSAFIEPSWSPATCSSSP